MAIHNIRGKKGEAIAAGFLSGLGFEIVSCNWRSGYYELDIIALRSGVLHFVEVKTRHSLAFGFPEEGVTRQKFGRLKKAAARFLAEYNWTARIQFDIVSVLCIAGRPPELLLIEDVYI